MNTEITDKEKFNGWVLYDGDCRLCLRMARRFRHLLTGQHFELLPLQTPWVRARLALPDSELLAEMRLLRPDGKFFGGADALLEIAGGFWWAWPLRQIGRIPAVTKILRTGYRWIARNRDCANGACEIEVRGDGKQSYLADFLLLVILPIMAFVLRPYLAPWVFMWAIAFALYGGCKWLTYREALRCEMRPGLFRALAYLFAWPGMDAADFLDTKNVPVKRVRPMVRAERKPQIKFALPRGFANSGNVHARFTQGGALADSRLPWATIGRPYRAFSLRLRRHLKILGDFLSSICAYPLWKLQLFKTSEKREWAFAFAKMAFGFILVWGVARTLLAVNPLLAGWVGMIGVVFILHFGLFHVLSLFWRRKGIKARPLMRNPIASTSLTEFWGRRWNTAFHELAFRYTFRPLRRITTPAIATLLVFGLSGLIHELCISVPAHGGYGLPTLYFLIQGLGTLIERNGIGRAIGLGQGICGWFFTLVVTVAPAFWLFHPPFIANIILPMLTAIGAT